MRCITKKSQIKCHHDSVTLLNESGLGLGLAITWMTLVEFVVFLLLRTQLFSCHLTSEKLES